MQSDQKLDKAVLEADSWDSEPVTGRDADDIQRFKLPSLERGKLSFSGNERNHLFHNRNGVKFNDVSGLSGLDTAQDGRTFAVWDFDRDGWQDVALLNVNTPVLSLFRNQQGMQQPNKQAPMVAFKFVGGNGDSHASNEFGPRDGYGVRVSLRFSDQTLVRQHRCGEGLAAQNSSTMFFGLGDHEKVDSAEIVWPSGVTQTLNNIEAGNLVTVHENTKESSDGSGFDVSRYLIDSIYKRPAVAVTKKAPFNHDSGADPAITIYTSVATWCPNCLKRLPQLKLLRKQFAESQLAIVGVPVDENDTEQMLKTYLAKHQPPYEFALPWATPQQASFSKLLVEKIGSDVLPATVAIDDGGNVLMVIAGVPTVSDIKRLLAIERQ